MVRRVIPSHHVIPLPVQYLIAVFRHAHLCIVELECFDEISLEGKPVLHEPVINAHPFLGDNKITYPRILGKYVRQDKILKLEEAIWKMSGFPAQQLGLDERGRIQEGSIADIVVFDSSRVIDKATFSEPHKFPLGIRHVIVNGVSVVADNKQNENLPGKILRHVV